MSSMLGGFWLTQLSETRNINRHPAHETKHKNMSFVVDKKFKNTIPLEVRDYLLRKWNSLPIWRGLIVL